MSMTSTTAIDLYQSRPTYPQPAVARSSGYTEIIDEIFSFLLLRRAEHFPIGEQLLGSRADHHAGTSVQNLLNMLNQVNKLQWTTIAKLVGVSVTALNKWRIGGPISAENNAELRRLVAFVEIVSNDRPDVAGWLASKPVPSVPLTRGDVYLAGGQNLLLDDAACAVSNPRSLLDNVFPGWASIYGPHRGLAVIWWDPEIGSWLAEVEDLQLLVDEPTREQVIETLITLIKDVLDEEQPTGVRTELVSLLRHMTDRDLRQALLGQ